MSKNIHDLIEERAEHDSGYAIAFALLRLADAQKQTAINIKNLDTAFIGERIEVAAGAVADALRDRD